MTRHSSGSVHRRADAGLVAAVVLLSGGLFGDAGAQVSPDSALPRGETAQTVDTGYVPPHLGRPAFTGAGPVVVIDAAHRNFHTADARYAPFAKLLRDDGFRVLSGRRQLDSASLEGVDVLVIANALGAGHEDVRNWTLPARSAFDATEIAATAAWVRRGGSLLLIADHMPFAGDAAPLAAAFGVELVNGFALVGEADSSTGDYPLTFRASDGSLTSHAVTRGRRQAERIDSVTTFTGSALRLVGDGTGLLRLPARTRVVLPSVTWQFTETTPVIAGEGLYQGVVLPFGRGRVAVFGEAAMFTAQRKGRQRAPMGMNAPAAAQNGQFTLNVMRWLARAIR
jgi:hypothetical protein